ncbi:hypothetical protein GX48_01963 [Paracoccidioides brasiliensis]|nr:hypothetical protein GX48_01963 [Paracoccidioides brasiliensis]
MVLGETHPNYRAGDSTLHSLDCFAKSPEPHILHVYPDTGAAQGKARELKLQDSVSVASFRQGKPDSYITAYYQGIYVLLMKKREIFEILMEIIPTDQKDIIHFNDGVVVNAKGRLWLAEIDKKAMAYGTNKLPSSYGEPKGRL